MSDFPSAAYDRWKTTDPRDCEPEPPEDDFVICVTCGDRIDDPDHAHLCGWTGIGNEKTYECDACFGQRPEVVAGRELEARADRKDGK